MKVVYEGEKFPYPPRALRTQALISVRGRVYEGSKQGGAGREESDNMLPNPT